MGKGDERWEKVAGRLNCVSGGAQGSQIPAELLLGFKNESTIYLFSMSLAGIVGNR